MTSLNVFGLKATVRELRDELARKALEIKRLTELLNATTGGLTAISSLGKGELTDKQAEILEFIRLYTLKFKRSPTHQEIQMGFDFHSVNAATQHVRALTRKGWIQTTPRISRSIQVVP